MAFASAVNVQIQIGTIKGAKELGYQGVGKRIWTACEKCGKERWVQLVRGKPDYPLCRLCANTDDVKRKRSETLQATLLKQDPHERRGENCHNWKNGKTKTVEGYVLIKVQPDDFFYPMVNNVNGYALEHRLVMAKSLGRNLHTWEIIHHKNGVKDDNRIENLQLVSDDRHNAFTQLERQLNRLKMANKQLLDENKTLKKQLSIRGIS